MDNALSSKARVFSQLIVSVTEIAQMPFREALFRYEESRLFLESCGLDINDFYFDKFSPFAWFLYYSDFVLIEIPAFNPVTLDAMDIAGTIRLQTEHLQACLQKRDFRTFFSLVDKRIALEVFLKYYPLIPDEQKYRLFWHTFSRSRLSLDYFQPSFMREIQCHQRELKLPELLTVYRGHHGDAPLSAAWSWTLDINTAIFYAGRNGRIYQGQLPKRQVLAYLKYRKENEIICFPGAVEDIQEMQFKSWHDLKPELERYGLLKDYEEYASRLKDGYFHKPAGIHGQSHTRRVLLLSLILAWREGLDGADRDVLCQAALYHDIGRSNDNFDPRHGRESYKKAVALNLLIAATEEQEILRFLIENHCVSDHQALKLLKHYRVTDPDRLISLYRIFKDADGLDRIRISDLDVNQLRTASAPQLLRAARDLLETIV